MGNGFKFVAEFAALVLVFFMLMMISLLAGVWLYSNTCFGEDLPEGGRSSCKLVLI